MAGASAWSGTPRMSRSAAAVIRRSRRASDIGRARPGSAGGGIACIPAAAAAAAADLRPRCGTCPAAACTHRRRDSSFRHLVVSSGKKEFKHHVRMHAVKILAAQQELAMTGPYLAGGRPAAQLNKNKDQQCATTKS